MHHKREMVIQGADGLPEVRQYVRNLATEFGSVYGVMADHVLDISDRRKGAPNARVLLAERLMKTVRQARLCDGKYGLWIAPKRARNDLAGWKPISIVSISEMLGWSTTAIHNMLRRAGLK